MVVAAAGAMLLASLAGCETYDETSGNTTFQQPDDGSGAAETQPLDPAVGQGAEGACARTLDCRFGLVCDEGSCLAVANTAVGGLCILTDECAEELYCSHLGTCADSGSGDVGAACSHAGDCQRGLYCRFMGLMGSCSEPGPGDVYAECEGTEGCRAGLVCDDASMCMPSSVLFGFEPWAGVACAAADEGPPRPYFELSGASGEFFRLPYPNDLRSSEGTVDLSDFPGPGVGLAGFDPIAAIAEAAARTQTGSSLTPTVFFRFSSGMNFESISGAANSVVAEPTLQVVNIDVDSPRYGSGPSYNWHVTDGAGSKSICPRWLAVRVDWHRPLDPGTTYATYLTSGVMAADGTPMVADADFTLMMSDDVPADDPVTAAKWATYAPLRGYLDEEQIPRGSVIGGTVFTTQRPHDMSLAVRAAVRDTAQQPAPDALTLCGDGVTSPCPTGPAACDGVEGEVDVLHLTMELPRIQQGIRPFLESGDGGGLTVTDDGLQVHGADTVCAALSVPRGPMPAAGWPVLLYAHAGEGDFAAAMPAAAQLMAEAGVAVLTWDGPMHGSRGVPGYCPEAMVHNLRNPSAAMGNLYQGAADIFALVRAVGAWSVAAAESPTGAAIGFDASRVALLGHGIGASVGALAAPYEPGIGLTVWSSAAGSWTEIMALRASPVDVPYGMALLLHEFGDKEVAPPDTRHPVLSLYQALLEPVDPLSHLSGQADPLGSGAPQHVMQIQGIGDWYAPSRVTDVVARLIDAQLTSPILRDISGVDNVAPPVTNNAGSEVVPRTSVIVQVVPPDNQDGDPAWTADRAWLEDAPVRSQVQAFVSSWVDTGVPTLPVRPEL